MAIIFKLLGCILVIISSTYIGFSIASKYVKRAQQLRFLQVAFQMLESEIVFSVNPLPEAFDRISKNAPENINKLFSYCSQLLKQKIGITAREAWTKSINKYAGIMNLEKEDKEILIAFGSSLGCSDKENQIKNIHLICSKLSIEEKKAEDLRQKNEKMYKNLGLLAGILLSILLV